MKSTAERNREIKKYLTEMYGKGVSVRGGRGTAYGWVEVRLNGNFSNDEVLGIQTQLSIVFGKDLDTFNSDDGYGTEHFCLLVSN